MRKFCFSYYFRLSKKKEKKVTSNDKNYVSKELFFCLQNFEKKKKKFKSLRKKKISLNQKKNLIKKRVKAL